MVTSPTGAVIRDILHRLADRFPVRVIVWPVRVQGETSAAEVAAAIDGFNALAVDGKVGRPDVLIVARGGGSLEDLMSFNDEAVVRAVARSAIPLIAAVGHETDWTLIDHAADVRAPTPTAAAEFAVPVRAELLAAIADLEARRRGAILRFSHRLRAELRALARALPSGEAIIASPASGSTARAMRSPSAWEGRSTSVRCARRDWPAAWRAIRRAPISRGSANVSAASPGVSARIRPLLIERPRRATEAAGRTFGREAALLARRRVEQAATIERVAARLLRAYDERLQAKRGQLGSPGNSSAR